jgi:hypothetical protein
VAKILRHRVQREELIRIREAAVMAARWVLLWELLMCWRRAVMFAVENPHGGLTGQFWICGGGGVVGVGAGGRGMMYLRVL